MKSDQEIKTEQIKDCLLCGRQGTPRYVNLPDRLFDAPGLWDLQACPSCGLTWLSPRPIAADLGKSYAEYYTHGAETQRNRMDVLLEKVALPVITSKFGYSEGSRDSRRRLWGKMLGLIPLCNDVAVRYIMGLRGEKRGKLLDVGCGDGAFLADMQNLGWDIAGVETDPEAAKTAGQRLGMEIVAGSLENARLAPDSFDAVTLRHVIEHVADPVSLLRECQRILKPGGVLAITTPNLDSLGHRLFGSAWRDLDPPRHLHLYSFRTLKDLAELAAPGKFSIEYLNSIGVFAGQIAVTSRSIKKTGRWKAQRLTKWQLLSTAIFTIVENFVKLFAENAGEEILLTAKKK